PKLSRFQVTTSTQAPPTTRPPTVRVDAESLHKAFNIGFQNAVNPSVRFHHGTGFGHPATDMEYEDLENEDEDENVEDASSGEDEETHPADVQGSNHANKEIVVRYDDEAEESESSESNRA